TSQIQRSRKLHYTTTKKKQNYNIGCHFHETTSSSCHVFDNMRECVYCRAALFPTETQGASDTAALIELFVRHDNVSKDFHKNIRAYNNAFAFTSMGIKLDKHLANMQGGIYHSIRLLIPVDDIPKFLQLYIYDTEFETTNRLIIMPRLCQDTLEFIKTLLNQLNPFIANFYLISSCSNITNLSLYIKADYGLDQRIYNMPTASQVAAIWIESNNPTNNTKREMIGRIYAVNPIEEECYYLRILLNNIKGAMSFADLKLVNGYLCSTFKESAMRRNLIEKETIYNETMREATQFQMPFSL
ncbi:15230_t:CDS:2, partial [Racocetra fulgida]